VLIAGFPAGSFQANCFVLAAEAGGPCVVVDPGQDALDALDELVVAHGLRPVGVLLTHGHLDHTASAAAFSDAKDIPVFIHPADEYMLTEPLSALSAELQVALRGLPIPGRPHTVLPMADLDELDLAGLPLVVDHVPGHTGGSVVLRLAGDGDRPEVLLTGDTLFAGSIGRTDLPGGSMEQELGSIRDRIFTRPGSAVVLPGHGPQTTVGAERAGNPFLTAQALARIPQTGSRRVGRSSGSHPEGRS
jgi:glyoxylase-like metal-dependent hydrolase (beta-lactamase superfamily II)